MNNPLISPGLGIVFWMLIAFGILFFVLAKFGWPVLLKALNEREKSIKDALAAADKAKEEMQQLQSHNDDLLKAARQERDQMLRHARQTSDQIIEEARIKASTEADRIVATAKENIEYEKLRAITELKNQIANISIDIAERLIQEELSDKSKASQLVQQSIDKAKEEFSEQ